MEWFTGSIPEAISTAKVQNSVFVVFISDSSEESRTTEESLNSSGADLKSNVVAIKLINDSEVAKQFSQIYPVLVVPSLYFINPVTGVPVEILGGAVTAQTLNDKLTAILQAVKNTSAVSTSQDNNTSSTSSTTPTDTTTTTVPAATSDAACDAVSDDEEVAAVPTTTTAAVTPPCDASSSAEPASSASAAADQSTDAPQDASISSAGSSQQPLEERIARAKELAQLKQQHRDQEARQKELDDEVQRRDMGKEMRRVKEDQVQKEMREATAQRRKDKQDDILARERVKAQIAADRAERGARAALLRGETPASSPASAASPAPAASSTSSTTTMCRLKIRLPDGSSSLSQFSPTALLSEVHEHVATNMQLPFSRFRLASSLHQRPFTEQDLSTSLTDLGLMPSSIVLVLPQSGGSSSSRGGELSTIKDSIVSTFMWLVQAPYSVVLWVLAFVTGRPAADASSADRSGQQQRSSDGQTTEGSSAAASSDTVRRRANRPKTAYGTREQARYRREGNIHRLNNDDDDDDESNTWNGNSTQQM